MMKNLIVAGAALAALLVVSAGPASARVISLTASVSQVRMACPSAGGNFEVHPMAAATAAPRRIATVRAASVRRNATTTTVKV